MGITYLYSTTPIQYLSLVKQGCVFVPYYIPALEKVIDSSRVLDLLLDCDVSSDD